MGKYSQVRQEFPPETKEEAIDRLAWRHSLSDTNVRALCYDYLIGYQDVVTYDAFLEYERRFGPAMKPGKNGRSVPRKPGKGRPRHLSLRYEKPLIDFPNPLPGDTIIG